MAPVIAVLIAALALGGCLQPRPGPEARAACGGCHAPHRVGSWTCEDCHRGRPDATRKELAHARLLTGRAAEHRLRRGPAVREGARLAETFACRRCHVIAGLGNRLAADLGAAVAARQQPELQAALDAPAEGMPWFGFDRRQVEALIAYLLSVSRANAHAATYRVHFARPAAAARSAFEKRCGGCHRLLTPRGSIGLGRAGPNLSGLFGAFYPASAPEGARWSLRLLTRWLENPRKLRPGTTMPPVALGDAELHDVLDALRSAGGS